MGMLRVLELTSENRGRDIESPSHATIKKWLSACVDLRSGNFCGLSRLRSTHAPAHYKSMAEISATIKARLIGSIKYFRVMPDKAIIDDSGAALHQQPAERSSEVSRWRHEINTRFCLLLLDYRIEIETCDRHQWVRFGQAHHMICSMICLRHFVTLILGQISVQFHSWPCDVKIYYLIRFDKANSMVLLSASNFKTIKRY